MTSPIVVGEVAVEVSASARGLAKQLRDSVVKEFKGAGIDKALTDALSKRKIKVPVEPVVDDRTAPTSQTPSAPRTSRAPRTQAPDPDPLLRAFQQDVQRQLRALARQAVKIPVEPDTDELRQGISDALAEVRRTAKAEIPVEPAGRQEYERNLRTLLVQVSERVRLSLPAPEIKPPKPVKVPVEVEPLTNAFQQDVRRQVATLARSVQANIPVTADTDGLRRRLGAQLAEIQRQSRLTVPTEPGARQAYEARLRAMLASVQRSLPPIRQDVRVNVDRSSLRSTTATLSRLGKTAGGLVKVASALGAIGGAVAAGATALAGLASVAGGAIQLLAGLAAAAVAASGALLALPGGLSIAAVGVGTLALAAAGMSDAFKAAAEDGANLNEVVKDLAPSAQQLVRQVVALRPAWEAMQRAVQQSLFAKVANDLHRLSRLTLPTLRAGFVDVAGVLNTQLRDALAELSTANTRIRLAEIFENAKGAIDNLTVAVRPLIRALADVTAVGAGIIREQTTGLGRLIADVSARLSEMAESGELRTLILDGLEAIRQFGAAAADVLGIVKGIFAAAPVGGGLFALLDQLNTLVNSVQGQSALSTLFTNLAEVGRALTPVLLAVAQALGPVSAAIADIAVAFAPTLVTLVQSLGTALASLAPGFIALSPLVDALSRGLQPLADILVDLVVGAAPGLTAFVDGLVVGLRALAPAAQPVGEALGALGRALAPLLPVLGTQLANVLTVAAGLIAVVGTELTPLIELFSSLATTMAQALLPVLSQLAQQLLPILAQAGVQIAEAFAPLIPVIAQVAVILAQQLAAALPTIIETVRQLVPILVSLATTLGQTLLSALVQLLPHLPSLIQSGILLAVAFVQLLAAVYPILPSLIQLATLVAQAAISSGVLRSAIIVMTVAIVAATNTVRLIVGAINLLRAPLDAAAAAAGRMGAAIRAGAAAAQNAVRALPGQIRSAIGDTGRILYNAGRNVIDGLINGIRSKFGPLAGAMGQAAQLVKDYWPFSPAKRGPLSGRGNPYYSGQSIVKLLAGGVRSSLPDATAAAADLATAFTLDHYPISASLAVPDPVVDTRSPDSAVLASAIKSALQGVTVQMDGRTVGYLTGRDAGILARS
ncbi:phage tail protein [Plantactinospora sp. WMMB782]|uniref:phage tail protein n=1 Tax=Plantactinospora sp. WMMB782 TaxID=3404121 RepID=UPI003B95EDF2